ncbi:MAG: DUF4252 domain-containing protein [Ignavibacteriales bacterium]|nr:MAG: DUF4252 domain-containing protein [Ignavibacteriales bacterium]
MKKIITFSPLLLIALISLSGCIGVNKNFSEMSSNLISKFGNDYHREIEVSVGPLLINFASWVVNFSQEDEIVDDLMRQVSNVQVGVYKMTTERDSKKNKVMDKINKEMISRGWTYIVRSYNDDELTGIYVSNDPEMFFKKMFVITHDSEQLVLVEVEGKLDKLIELAIRDKKFEFDM